MSGDSSRSPEGFSGSSGASSSSILRLAWPALLVLAAPPLYLLLDTAVVGRRGAEDLAALAAGAAILAAVTTQLTFIAYGTTAHSARLFGAGRMADALYEGVQATWVAVCVGVVLVALVWTSAPHLMHWLADDPAVAAKATGWLRVVCGSIIPALISMAGNGWMRGMSNTRVPLYFTVAGVIPMALFVPWSVHRYGLVGSAYANVLGESIIGLCFLVALSWAWVRYGDGRSMAPQWSVIRPQLVMGRDLIVRSLSLQAAFLSAAAVAGRMGSVNLAAHQVMLQLWNFLLLVLDSVAIAAQALVGAALGAGHTAVARAIAGKVLRFSLIAAGVLAVALSAGAWVIPRLFTRDAGVVDALFHPWWLLVLLVMVGGVVFALDGVLLGAGDVNYLRNTTVAATLLGFIPVVWLAYACGWGLTGVWWGFVALMVGRLCAVWWRYGGDAWLVSSGSGSSVDNKH